MSTETPNNNIVRLDEKYSTGELSKVGVVIKVYDSNRTDAENSQMTFQAFAYLALFTAVSAGALLFKSLISTNNTSSHNQII